MSALGLGRVETLAEGIKLLWPAALGDFRSKQTPLGI
jgi:hypothetical protein